MSRCGSSRASFTRHEECDRFFSIDEPVIVRQSHIHHGPDYDLVIDGDGPVQRLVHPENTGLWGVEDRRREQRAVYAAVGRR